MSRLPIATNKVLACLLVLAAGGVALWINGGRMLDDAYIHLRYAWHLKSEGRLDFNTGQPSSGSSAVGYTVVLALLGLPLPRELWPPMIQTLSIACWLFAAAAWARLLAPLVVAERAASNGRIWVVALAVALLFTPASTARWFHDGMETSMVTACALGSVLAVECIAARRRVSRSGVVSAIGLGVLLALPSLIRVDGILLTAGAVALAAYCLRGTDRNVAMATTALLVMANLVVLYVTYGGHLPDSMTAKAEPTASRLTWFIGFCKAMLTASPLWFGFLLFPLRQARSRQHALQLLIILGPFAVLWAAGFFRKQAIHGARYFIPSLAWALAATAHLLAREGQRIDLGSRLQRRWLAIVGVLAGLHATALTYRSLGFASSFELPKETVGRDVRLMSFDIGIIGWYTDAVIMDVSGLVNGRRVAEAKLPERPCILIEELGAPNYLMMRLDQAAKLGAQADSVEFRCAEGSHAYENKGRAVMKGEQFSGTLTMYLWEPSP